jgi:UTP--glucose-1-phosphate uridylyltransferase
LGTRLLPITRYVPKELLPAGGKPAIQRALEEGVRAGLGEFIIVISPGKTVIRDYLTPLDDAQSFASNDDLRLLERLLRSVKIAFVEQPRPIGLGDAILRCKAEVGDDSFALLLPDNVFGERSGLLEELMTTHRAHQKSCIGMWNASGPALSDGAVIAESRGDSLYFVRRVLPKGRGFGELSNLRPIGRSVLTSGAFAYLENGPDVHGELDDQPMLDGLARNGLLNGLLSTEEFQHLGVERSLEFRS